MGAGRARSRRARTPRSGVRGRVRPEVSNRLDGGHPEAPGDGNWCPSTVVDLGAGTGQFALAITPYVRQVIAVDVSAPMVARLRERGVEAVHAGFLTYEHSGDPADAVVTRNALHHLPDFWKAVALTRIAEMLSAEGVLVVKDLVFSFDPDEGKAAFEYWFSSA